MNLSLICARQAQRGSTFLGIILGVVVGLAAALGVAIYVFHVETEIRTEWPILGSFAGLVGAHAYCTNRWGLGTAAPVAFGRRLWGVVVRCDGEVLRALPGGSVLRRKRTRRTKAT